MRGGAGDRAVVILTGKQWFSFSVFSVTSSVALHPPENRCKPN